MSCLVIPSGSAIKREECCRVLIRVRDLRRCRVGVSRFGVGELTRPRTCVWSILEYRCIGARARLYVLGS